MLQPKETEGKFLTTEQYAFLLEKDIPKPKPEQVYHKNVRQFLNRFETPISKMTPLQLLLKYIRLHKMLMRRQEAWLNSQEGFSEMSRELSCIEVEMDMEGVEKEAARRLNEAE